jgi:hypothetical protein
MKREYLIETIMPAAATLSVCESADGKKNLFLEGIAIQGEKQNHNGRIYPRAEIQSAVGKLTEHIEKIGPVTGELDHPEGLTISLKNASHVIQRMWMDGDNGNARFAVLEHGYGNTVRDLIKMGVKLGVSSRGSGSVNARGIVSDFDIITIDIVANPSAPDAYPTPILESLGNTALGRRVVTLADAARHDTSAQRFFEKELKAFINKVTGSR